MPRRRAQNLAISVHYQSFHFPSAFLENAVLHDFQKCEGGFIAALSEPTSNNEQCYPNEVLWYNFVNISALLHIPEVNVDMHTHRLQESFLLC